MEAKNNNLEGQGFHTNPERINKKGRPISIKNEIKKLLNADGKMKIPKEQIVKIEDDGGVTVKLPKKELIAHRLLGHAMSSGAKSVRAINMMLEHFDGKPKQTIEQFNDTGEITMRIIGDKAPDVDIVALEEKRFKWSMETFKEATPLGSLAKAREELDEVEADVKAMELNPEEYADVIMCVFDVAGRMGISAKEVMDAYVAKIAVNKGRKWVKQPDNSYKHE